MSASINSSRLGFEHRQSRSSLACTRNSLLARLLVTPSILVIGTSLWKIMLPPSAILKMFYLITLTFLVTFPLIWETAPLMPSRGGLISGYGRSSCFRVSELYFSNANFTLVSIISLLLRIHGRYVCLTVAHEKIINSPIF